jgi:four helix bundle protein
MVFQRAFDLAAWLLNHTAKYPKSHRFSLAVRTENAVLDVLENIAAANYRADKGAVLARADERLNGLRILLRLGYKLRHIATNSYEYACREIDEIGKLLGGWIRQQKAAALKRG